VPVSARSRSQENENALLELARNGDESAFGDLIEAHRAELIAHCYRMLGSFHDAEDAVQDALVRAWRALASFEGRSSVRSWLYAIVTNTALDIAGRRSRRELAVTFAPAAPPGTAPGEPVREAAWLEPFPDRAVGADPDLSPEARYEQRESLELAFVVALQHLPAMQRAALILRDVMGFSAQEVAVQLRTSVPAVTSALQRARASAESRLPARSQQVMLRSLGDVRVRALAGRYADAIERGDTDVLVSMLTEDATWAMPPIPTWYGGLAAISEFHRDYVFGEDWRHVTTSANGQLAVGCYIFDPGKGCYVAAVIDVLTLEGDRIASVDGFQTAVQLRRMGFEGNHLTPDVVARFGLPAELP
jgi:RNA polymerase sigma-70 factor (ECF subfamily)